MGHFSYSCVAMLNIYGSFHRTWLPKRSLELSGNFKEKKKGILQRQGREGEAGASLALAMGRAGNVLEYLVLRAAKMIKPVLLCQRILSLLVLNLSWPLLARKSEGSLPNRLNKNAALNITNEAAFCCGNIS